MFSLLKISNRFNRVVYFSLNELFLTRFNNYSTPVVGGLGKSKKSKQVSVAVEKKILPVEEDTNKLVSYVCGSNILKEGSDIQLKPDSEYPEWLWNLHIGPPLKLEEIEPGSLKYWRKVRVEGMKKNNALKRLRKF